MTIDSKYGIQLRERRWPENAIFKFGFKSAVSTTEQTIWDVGGIYSYPSSALSMTATSASGATDAGVQITVVGLNADWSEVSQTVTLGASGAATLPTSLIRCYRAYVSGSQAPVGDISIASGSTNYARILAGENQTLMAVYTVPAGYTGYMHQGTISSGTSQSNKYATARLKVRSFGGVFRTASVVTLHNQFLPFDFGIPVQIPEKSDVEARAITSSGADDISITFTMILVPN